MPLPKKSVRYDYTLHALNKMRYYKLSKSRVEDIIKHPIRMETGIIPDTVAVMSPGETKDRPSEIWVLYKAVKDPSTGLGAIYSNSLRIITAWRYPGISRERDPIPPHVLEEIEALAR